MTLSMCPTGMLGASGAVILSLRCPLSGCAVCDRRLCVRHQRRAHRQLCFEPSGCVCASITVCRVRFWVLAGRLLPVGLLLNGFFGCVIGENRYLSFEQSPSPNTHHC